MDKTKIWIRKSSGRVICKFGGEKVPRKGDYFYLGEKRFKVKRVEWWESGGSLIADIYLNRFWKVNFKPWSLTQKIMRE